MRIKLTPKKKKIGPCSLVKKLMFYVLAFSGLHRCRHDTNYRMGFKLQEELKNSTAMPFFHFQPIAYYCQYVGRTPSLFYSILYCKRSSTLPGWIISRTTCFHVLALERGKQKTSWTNMARARVERVTSTYIYLHISREGTDGADHPLPCLILIPWNPAGRESKWIWNKIHF
jgi:hypothetical protein